MNIRNLQFEKTITNRIFGNCKNIFRSIGLQVQGLCGRHSLHRCQPQSARNFVLRNWSVRHCARPEQQGRAEEGGWVWWFFGKIFQRSRIRWIPTFLELESDNCDFIHKILKKIHRKRHYCILTFFAIFFKKKIFFIAAICRAESALNDTKKS